MSDTWDGGYEDSIDDGHEFAEKELLSSSEPFEEEGGRAFTLDDPRSEKLDKGVQPARFKGICVICDEPINIGDAVELVFQDGRPKVFPKGLRHDHCSRRGPGGTRVPARVPPPGNPPKESAVRRRLFPAEDDD